MATLDQARGGLHGSCSCPFGAEGNFCKHCVATGLVALKGGDQRPARTAAPPRLARQPLAAWLNSLSKDELVTELLDVVEEGSWPALGASSCARRRGKRTP